MKRITTLLIMLLAAVLLPSSLWAQRNFVYTNDGLCSNPDSLRPDQPPNNTVSAFSVASDGTLTPVPGSPFTTGAIACPDFFAFNGMAIAGHFLFASNPYSGTVSAFTIDPDTGVLTLVAGSPFPTGNRAGSAVINLSATPDGSFLMAAIGGITVFSIGPNGTLTPIAGSPFLTLAPGARISVSPDGKFLAVSERSSVTLSVQTEMFSIASNGSLTSLGAFEGIVGDNACSTSFWFMGVGHGGLLSPDDKILFIGNTGGGEYHHLQRGL